MIGRHMPAAPTPPGDVLDRALEDAARAHAEAALSPGEWDKMQGPWRASSSRRVATGLAASLETLATAEGLPKDMQAGLENAADQMRRRSVQS